MDIIVGSYFGRISYSSDTLSRPFSDSSIALMIISGYVWPGFLLFGTDCALIIVEERSILGMVTVEEYPLLVMATLEEHSGLGMTTVQEYARVALGAKGVILGAKYVKFEQ